jgi:hypothetical protein
MNDTAILDWIERYVTGIVINAKGTVITWLERGLERQTVGRDLRDAVQQAQANGRAR